MLVLLILIIGLSLSAPSTVGSPIAEPFRARSNIYFLSVSITTTSMMSAILLPELIVFVSMLVESLGVC